MKKSSLLLPAVSLLAIVSVTAVGMHSFSRAATPSPAIAFGSLTTIYIGSGAYDDGGGPNAGIATTVHCSNVSGNTTQLRAQILGPGGNVEASATNFALPHGNTFTFSTHGTPFVNEIDLNTGFFSNGVINVESTQSAVFCTAMVIQAGSVATGVALHLVRGNPNPGTVE
jgi:hypothetical protein